MTAARPVFRSHVLLPALALLIAAACQRDDNDRSGLATSDTTVPTVEVRGDAQTTPTTSQTQVDATASIRCNAETFFLAALSAERMRPAPPPAEGYQLVISADYNAMVRQAPVLDPHEADFHEGNARFWLETLLKMFVVVSDLTSPDFQSLVRSLESRAGALTENMRVPLNLGTAREMIQELRSFRPTNDYDTYAQQFHVGFLTSLLEFTEITIQFNDICQALDGRALSDTERGEATRAMRDLIDRTQGIIFAPTPDLTYWVMRTALWRALQHVERNVIGVTTGP